MSSSVDSKDSFLKNEHKINSLYVLALFIVSKQLYISCMFPNYSAKNLEHIDLSKFFLIYPYARNIETLSTIFFQILKKGKY